MNNPQRITPQLLAVLRVLVEQQDGERLYGQILVDQTGLRSGAVTNIVSRLAGLGWLDEEWEVLDAGTARPRRKYVCLTVDGREAAQHVLTDRTTRSSR